MVRRVNPLVRDPLLRKGGPHRKSNSSERREGHSGLTNDIEDWMEERSPERPPEESSSEASGAGDLTPVEDSSDTNEPLDTHALPERRHRPRGAIPAKNEPKEASRSDNDPAARRKK